jgi:hypothetical protein
MCDPMNKFEPSDLFDLIKTFAGRLPEQDNFRRILNVIKIDDVRSQLLSKSIDSAEKQWEQASKLAQPLVTKKQGLFPKAESTCFLCGCKIDDSIPGLQAQCEHLLPAAAAFLTIGIPEDTREPRELSQRAVNNYKWAHACCNNVKQATLFVNIFCNTSNRGGLNPGVITLQKPVVDAFLSAIWNSKPNGPTLDGFNAIRETYGNNPQAFYTGAANSIATAYSPLLADLNNDQARGISLIVNIDRVLTNIDFTLWKAIQKIEDPQQLVLRRSFDEMMSNPQANIEYNRILEGKLTTAEEYKKLLDTLSIQYAAKSKKSNTDPKKSLKALKTARKGGRNNRKRTYRRKHKRRV